MSRTQYFSGPFSVQDDSLDHPRGPCVRIVNKEVQICYSERYKTILHLLNDNSSLVLLYAD